MIDTEKYQPTRHNMKFETRSLRSLSNKLYILARQADVFGINNGVPLCAKYSEIIAML
jgi:hypothetical protein